MLGGKTVSLDCFSRKTFLWSIVQLSLVYLTEKFNMELSEATAMIPSPAQHHCPFGLEGLTWIDQLFVYKEETLEECLTEVCCGLKSNNCYTVTDDTGNKVFSIVEDSDCCYRQFCPKARSFIMNVINGSNQLVIRMVHPIFWTICNSQELEIQSPPDIIIGYVRQNWHACLPKFTVENERGEPAFKIMGPFVACTCCTDENFELVSLNGEATQGSFGKIFKPFSWSGPNKCPDFILKFPRSLDVKMKAALLGACMLIDYMYYERSR